MKKFTSIISLIIVATSMMVGCSKSIDVPEGKYALLLRFGKIEKSVVGPGKIDKAIITEHVLYINKKNKVTIGNGKYKIKYIVTDPELYYIKLGNSNSNIQRILEKNIANRALNGEIIDSKKAVLKLIEDLNLPIKVEDIT